MINKKPTFIDLFSGAGGLTEGFLNAGFKCLACFENWEPAILTHNHNYPNIKLITKDIRKLNKKDLISNKIKKVDVIIGGPPCQGFSTIGKRKNNDFRNSLIYEFARIVNLLKPKIFLMENVRGLMSPKMNNIRSNFIKKLNNFGYTNIISSTLCAADYGVPQLRYRVFFLGTKMKKEIAFPAKTHSEENYEKIENFIRDLEKDTKKLSNHIPMKHNEIVKKRISFIPEGSGITKKIPKKYLKGSRSDFQNNSIKNFSHIYKRLHYKKPSTTMVPGHNAFPLHPKLDRSLTVREAARIQSIPDKIKFFGTRQDQCILVGNAVPVLMAKKIALNIKKQL